MIFLYWLIKFYLHFLKHFYIHLKHVLPVFFKCLSSLLNCHTTDLLLQGFKRIKRLLRLWWSFLGRSFWFLRQNWWLGVRRGVWRIVTFLLVNHLIILMLLLIFLLFRLFCLHFFFSQSHISLTHHLLRQKLRWHDFLNFSLFPSTNSFTTLWSLLVLFTFKFVVNFVCKRVW